MGECFLYGQGGNSGNSKFSSGTTVSSSSASTTKISLSLIGFEPKYFYFIHKTEGFVNGKLYWGFITPELKMICTGESGYDFKYTDCTNATSGYRIYNDGNNIVLYNDSNYAKAVDQTLVQWFAIG